MKEMKEMNDILSALDDAEQNNTKHKASKVRRKLATYMTTGYGHELMVRFLYVLLKCRIISAGTFQSYCFYGFRIKKRHKS